MASLGISSRLQGKTALITGASAGIGAATAILFARCGAKVIITARRADRLADVKAQCLAAYQESTGSSDPDAAVTVEVDMTNKDGIDSFITKLEDTRIDILVNNAGMARDRANIGDISDDDVDVMIQTNVIGLIRMTQPIVRKMKNQKSGTIINVGSVAGREAYAGGSIYCATKHAIVGFSQALMKELVNTPVRVCEIQPGMVETEFSIARYNGDTARAHDEHVGLQPLTAHDIAEEIVWCASRPEHVQIAQMLIFPSAQASVEVSHREA